jgi:hypothetical protein
VKSHHQNTAKVEREGKMKQGIRNEKVIKDSSQLPQNKSLKIFHQNIRGLGNKQVLHKIPEGDNNTLS